MARTGTGKQASIETLATGRGDDPLRELGSLAEHSGISGAGLYRSLLEVSGDGIKVLTPDGRLDFISEAGLKALGVDDAASLKDSYWPDWWSGDGRTKAAAALAAARRGAASRFEATMAVNGVPTWWDCQVSPIRNAANRVEKVLCISRDITPFKQAELKSVRANLRLRLVMQAAEIGTWDYDLAERTLEVDRRARSILGLPLSGPVAYARSVVALVHPEDKRDFAAALRMAMDPASDGDVDVTCRILDSETSELRWIELSGSAIVERGETKRLLGTIHDVTARKKAEQHRELLLGEMRHRLKNAFAMVQAIANQTFNDAVSLGNAQQIFAQRIAALAQASDVFTASEWSRAAIDKVVAAALAPYRAGDAPRLHAAGPPQMLSAKQALTLSLALHELATNAVKYGALSNDTGTVDITWRVTAEQQAPARFVFEWREEGGPPLTPPARKGFGTKLIERGLAAEFDAEVTLDYRPEGLVCSLVAPLAKLRS